MDTSVFIARLLGPVLLLLGLVVLTQPDRMRAIGREMIAGESMIFLSGMLTLPLGLTLVNTHNLWVADWPLIITLFGWIAVAAGIARLAVPGPTKAMGEAMLDRRIGLALPAVTMIVLGGVLTWAGYL